MKRRFFGLIGLSLFAAGCAQAPKTVWIRTDGQHIPTNPANQQKFELDKIACTGEAQKAGLSGVSFSGGGFGAAMAQASRDQAAMDVAKGCMADRGYLLVLEAEATSRLAAAAEATQAAQKAQVASMVADKRAVRH